MRFQSALIIARRAIHFGSAGGHCHARFTPLRADLEWHIRLAGMAPSDAGLGPVA